MDSGEVYSNCAIEMQRLIRVITELTWHELFAIKQGLIYAIFGKHSTNQAVIIDIGHRDWPFYVWVARDGSHLEIQWSTVGNSRGKPQVYNEWSFSLPEHKENTDVEWDQALTACEQRQAYQAMRQLFVGRDLTCDTILRTATIDEWLNCTPLETVRQKMPGVWQLREFGFNCLDEPSRYPTVSQTEPEWAETPMERGLRVFASWKPYLSPNRYQEGLERIIKMTVSEWTVKQCETYLNLDPLWVVYPSDVHKMICRNVMRRLSSPGAPPEMIDVSVQASFGGVDAETQTEARSSVHVDTQTTPPCACDETTQTDWVPEQMRTTIGTQTAGDFVCCICYAPHVTRCCPFLEYLTHGAIVQLTTDRHLCKLCFEQVLSIDHDCIYRTRTCGRCKESHNPKGCPQRSQEGRILSVSQLYNLDTAHSAGLWFYTEMPNQIQQLKSELQAVKQTLSDKKQRDNRADEQCVCQRHERKRAAPSPRREQSETEPMDTTVDDEVGSAIALPNPVQTAAQIAAPIVLRNVPTLNTSRWLVNNVVLTEQEKQDLKEAFESRTNMSAPPRPFVGWGQFWKVVKRNDVPLVREQSVRCRQKSEQMQRQRYGQE